VSSNSNKAVFTSVQVLENLMPILYVVHDEDDDWQFLSGHEKGDDKDGRIIAFDEVLQIDASLNSILWIPSGIEAYRSDINAEWETRVRKDEK
jgi:hypothetical protein